MKRVIILWALILSSCAPPDERLALAPSLSRQAGWSWQLIPAGDFDLAVASSSREAAHQVLTVYLEGDGLAYVRPSQPSFDPTPTDPVALRLALKHPDQGAVAWIGRPCQYVLHRPARSCSVQYWTSHRYAPEVVDSIGMVLDRLKSQYGASHLMLVGYSGGGALAVLLAATRNDVDSIVTVVANLDLAYWARRDGLTPLSGSLDPATFAPKLGHVRQLHLTGEKDKVVGSDVVLSYMSHLPQGTPVIFREIKAFTHACCWVDAWPQVLRDNP